MEPKYLSAFPYTKPDPEGTCPFRNDQDCKKECALYIPNANQPHQPGACAIRMIACSKK
jgi:hypothetical protein